MRNVLDRLALDPVVGLQTSVMSESTRAAPTFVPVGQNDPLAATAARRAGRRVRRRVTTAPSTVSRLGCANTQPSRVRVAKRRHGRRADRRRPVTGGAFRRFDADTAELKRIWTDSAAPPSGTRPRAAGGARGRHRRPRVLACLSDHGRPPTRGRGAVSGHRVRGWTSRCLRKARSTRWRSSRSSLGS